MLHQILLYEQRLFPCGSTSKRNQVIKHSWPEDRQHRMRNSSQRGQILVLLIKRVTGEILYEISSPQKVFLSFCFSVPESHEVLLNFSSAATVLWAEPALAGAVQVTGPSNEVGYSGMGTPGEDQKHMQSKLWIHLLIWHTQIKYLRISLFSRVET